MENFPSVFQKTTTISLFERLSKLNPNSEKLWGTMTVSQMLAHINVPYQQIFEPQTKRPNAFVRFLLGLFLKPMLVGPKPYPKNSRTAPAFLINDQRDFNTELEKFKSYHKRVEELGAGYFEGRESHSIGKLTAKEWSNLLYKHTDHHLKQFGV